AVVCVSIHRDFSRQAVEHNIDGSVDVSIEEIGIGQGREGGGKARAVNLVTGNARPRVKVLAKDYSLLPGAYGRHLRRGRRFHSTLDDAALREIDTIHNFSGKYPSVVIAGDDKVAQRALIKSSCYRVVDHHQFPRNFHFEFDDRCPACRDQRGLNIFIDQFAAFEVYTIHYFADDME